MKYKDFDQKTDLSSGDLTDFDDMKESFLGSISNLLLIQYERKENLLQTPTQMVKIRWSRNFCRSLQLHSSVKQSKVALPCPAIHLHVCRLHCAGTHIELTP